MRVEFSYLKRSRQLYLGMIIFRLVWFLYKKKQTDFFFKKTKIDLNRLVLVRFFRTKTGWNRLGSVLTWFFLVWLDFFRFGFSLVFLVSDL